MAVIGIHCKLDAYIEVDLDEETITHQGLGGIDPSNYTVEIAYGRDKNGRKKAVPPSVRKLADEIVRNETLRGRGLDWPGWNWG
jgi:hypothetical protein